MYKWVLKVKNHSTLGKCYVSQNGRFYEDDIKNADLYPTRKVARKNRNTELGYKEIPVKVLIGTVREV